MADTRPAELHTSEKEDDDDSSSSSSLITITPTLPPNHPTRREGWWAGAPLLRLHGCWLTARLARSAELVRAEFKPRPDDVLLATFPKSGTTWLKALAFALLNRSRHPVITPPTIDHPLLSSNPHDLVPFLELPDRTLRPVAADLEALPSPRLLCTHLPPAHLPPAMLSSSRGRAAAAVVYLWRDPKDVFVSYWHHVRTLLIHHESHVDFNKAFELFCEGVSVCGPVWDHYLEYWKLSKRMGGGAMGTTNPNPNSSSSSRVLFLKYEEMMAEPAVHVRKLAEFLGVPFTEEEESGGAVEEVVRLCSFRNLKSLPVNAHGVSGQIGAAVGNPVKNSLWFRSGKVGDWENHLTPEMAQRLDRVVEEKLKGSGITF